MNPEAHADYRRQTAQQFGTDTTREHHNIALLPGEESLFAADFTPSPLLRHIKTGLVVTGDRIVVRHPQYMLFVIRVGHAESAIPIRQVANTVVGRQLSQRRVMYAVVSGFLGLSMLTSSVSAMGGFLGLLMLLLAFALLGFAAFQAWLARGLALMVTHTGGGTVRVEVDKAEYERMLGADSVIQQLTVAAAPSAPTPPPQRPTAAHTPPPGQEPPQYSRPPRPAGTSAPRPQSAAPPSIWRG
ncbi:hypothetical protein ACQI4L_19580 [Mycolicibacterium litorale]|uniref:hypothetical protein n=1 Tax=Mycolicibacterium litorale TaxID=758802 RepID=UPI003CF5C01A